MRHIPILNFMFLVLAIASPAWADSLGGTVSDIDGAPVDGQPRKGPFRPEARIPRQFQWGVIKCHPETARMIRTVEWSHGHYVTLSQPLVNQFSSA